MIVSRCKGCSTLCATCPLHSTHIHPALLVHGIFSFYWIKCTRILYEYSVRVCTRLGSRANRCKGGGRMDGGVTLPRSCAQTSCSDDDWPLIVLSLLTSVIIVPPSHGAHHDDVHGHEPGQKVHSLHAPRPSQPTMAVEGAAHRTHLDFGRPA